MGWFRPLLRKYLYGRTFLINGSLNNTRAISWWFFFNFLFNNLLDSSCFFRKIHLNFSLLYWLLLFEFFIFCFFFALKVCLIECKPVLCLEAFNDLLTPNTFLNYSSLYLNFFYIHLMCLLDHQPIYLCRLFCPSPEHLLVYQVHSNHDRSSSVRFTLFLFDLEWLLLFLWRERPLFLFSTLIACGATTVPEIFQGRYTLV